MAGSSQPLGPALVVEHGRARSSPTKGRGESRRQRLRDQVLAPERQMAAFDLENTLIASNVVESYSFLATRRLTSVLAARIWLADDPKMFTASRISSDIFRRLSIIPRKELARLPTSSCEEWLIS